VIEVATAGNQGMMAGLLDKLNQGGAARVRLYAGVRPSTATLIAVVYLAEPAGTLAADGSLVLTVGIESVVLLGTAPTWARVSNGAEDHVFDCDARLSTAANTGQEIVVTAPNGFYAGALVQIQSGVFSALP
jgi:hypothetical protein